MKRLSFCGWVPWALLLMSGPAAAMGLGELKGNPVLGESLRLEVPLLGAEKYRPDASCFRLIEPMGGNGLPWLKKASLSVPAGPSPVLEIRAAAPLREPIMQLTVQLGCGHEITKTYTLMASPAQPGTLSIASSDQPVAEQSSAASVQAKRSGGESRQRATPVARPVKASSRSAQPAKDQVEQQAALVQAAEDKLRAVENRLGELQQHAAELARRVEQESVPALAAAQPQQASQPQPAAENANVPAAEVKNPVKPAVVESPAPASMEADGPSEWSLYGVLLGVILALAGWMGWRRYQDRQWAPADDDATLEPVPAVVIDPARVGEREFADADVAPVPAAHAAMGGSESQSAGVTAQTAAAEPDQLPLGADSVFAVGAKTADELEANPVMELADIMLSFGRVKGAAQALQEYIDGKPQEALQPWIRLMDVYRMAGMREEFDNVARNLNQHFNVEVQRWDDESAGNELQLVDEAALQGARPQSLEDMPRLMNFVIDQWANGDVVGYLYQLLRDNRGGQRQGFSLPVVDDILLLIELKETANRMEKSQ